ncbi:MAG: hypothetical protein Q8M16_16940 [Pirellulaceae bacterium]|nr:hypothetical protein [Pirellulaceae bacterium]
MNQKPRTRWLIGAVLSTFVLLYACFFWQRAAVVLVRHSAAPGGPLGLDLQACLESERPEIRLAAAQRVADYSGDKSELLPIIRSVWTSDERVQELGWFLAHAMTTMDENASDLMALAAIAGFDSAAERFARLSGEQQAEALLRLLDEQDLETERGAGRASSIVLRLGSMGENADVDLPPYAESDHAMRMISATRIDSELAEKIAAKLLAFYRRYELPPVVELALLQLGKSALTPLCQELSARMQPDVRSVERVGLYRTLARMGPMATEAAPLLVRAVEFEPVNHTFVAAMTALIAIEPHDRTAAANAIRAANASERWKSAGYDFATIEAACIAALKDLGDDQTIDELIAELQGQRANEYRVRIRSIDAAQSWQTVRKLGQCGPRAARATEILTAGLDSQASAVRIEAAWALVRVGGDAQLAINVLSSFLDPLQTSPEDTGLALIAIAEIGWPKERSAQPLLRLLETGLNADLRILASNVLQKAYPDDHDLTDVFVRRLVAESDPRVRGILLNWMEARLHAPDAAGVPNVDLPQAIQWLRENWSSSRKAKLNGEQELQVWLAQRTLRASGADGATALAEWLAEDPDCPQQAIELFDDLGEVRRAALPILQDMLRADESEAVRRGLLRLGHMRGLASPAFPDAAKHLPESEAALRVIDPVAYLAGTSRIFEWIAIWLTPIVLLIGFAVDWGWTKYRKSAIMTKANLSGT